MLINLIIYIYVLQFNNMSYPLPSGQSFLNFCTHNKIQIQLYKLIKR